MRLAGWFDPRRSERGLATVEAVLVVPLVLVPVLLAVLVVDAAAAAGARQAAVVGADTAAVRERIAAELRDGGIDPGRAAVIVEPAIANWGEPIRVRVSIRAEASIPFLGSWPVPIEGEFVTRSEVTH
jgi:hypothetical protein